MNLQHQRITEMCEQLKLARLAGDWPALAQDTVREDGSFADFLEKILAGELAARDERRVSTMTKLSMMPAVKTLEQFDWACQESAQMGQPESAFTSHLADGEERLVRTLFKASFCRAGRSLRRGLF